MLRLKIYGERNTGTNYLERLLTQSAEADIYPGNVPPWLQRVYDRAARLVPMRATARWIEASRDRFWNSQFDYSPGWKHARVPVPAPPGMELPPEVRFVTLVKNPYSWLLSLQRRPYNYTLRASAHALPFSEFVQTPWPALGRENAPVEVYESPVHLWQDKVRSYQDLDALRPTSHLRYEDLLADPTAALNRIGAELGVAIDPAKADVTTGSKGDAGSLPGYQRYYLRSEWLEKLTPTDIETINRVLDPGLMTALGYRMLEPAEGRAVEEHRQAA